MKYFIIFSFLFVSTTIEAQNEINFLENEFNTQFSEAFLNNTNQPILYQAGLNERLQLIVDQFVNEKNIIGLSAAMDFPENNDWAYAVGSAEPGKLLTVDHLMPVGSISKTITSTTLLQLYDEGLIDLNDTIGQWISHEHIDPTITIKQCLNHTSGIFNYTDHESFNGLIFADMNKIWSAIDIINTFVGNKEFEKGTSWAYSNTNFLICGIIIEKITGLPFHEVVRTKILNEYNFEGIQLHPMESIEGELAHLWLESGGQIIDLNSTMGNLNAMFSAAWAAGAYISKPSELASFVKALFKGEILKPSTMVEMLTPFQLNADVGYGLGVFVYGTGSSKAYGHSGSIGYRSFMIYFPGLSVSVVISINDGTTAGNNFDDLVELLINEYLSFISNVEETSTIQIIKLKQNPIKDKLSFEISLDKRNLIKLDCINILGGSNTILQNKWYEEGTHLINIDVTNLVNGIYWLRCEINGQNQNLKFIICD